MQDFSEKIKKALDSLVFPAAPQGLYEPISYTLSLGGKRLRPSLVLLGCSLYQEDLEAALPVALALEIYHNHTLLHDDLMDMADMRRGRETVHKKWNANTAILSGDAMLIAAFQTMMKTQSKRKDELLRLFAKTAAEVCEGQQYDMNFETCAKVSEAQYIEMIRLKTSVLLACALKAGAVVGDAPEDDADLLYRFAEKIGLAFQLQDDYLDCFGDARVFGKAIGGDICAAKKTFLLIKALELADRRRQEKLNALLHCDTIERSEKIEEVLDIYRKLQIPALCEKAIEGFYAEAKELYDRLPLEEDRKLPLWNFATNMLHRTH